MPLKWVGNTLSRLFRYCLDASLDFPLAVFLVAVIIGVVAFFVFGSLKQELTPSEDRASVNLNLTAPPTASLDFTQSRRPLKPRLGLSFHGLGMVKHRVELFDLLQGLR